MLTLKEIKEKLQLPFNKSRGTDDWLSLYVYSPLARPIIKALLFTPVTANQVTTSMILIGVIGCLLFAFGSYWCSIIGIGLIHFHIILDHVDGPIARARNSRSLKGVYIERVGHDLIFTLFFYCIAFGALKRGFNPIFILTSGFLASFGYFFYKHTRLAKIYCELIYSRGQKSEKNSLDSDNPDIKIRNNVGLLRKIYRKTQILWEPVFFINITTLLAIFNLVYVIPIFYGLTYPIQFFVSYVYQANTARDWVLEWLKRI